MITFRDITAIRAIASETFDIADQPEVRAGLDDIMERLDVMLSDLATADAKIADATDALLEHVEPPKEPKPVPVIEPFDIHRKIAELFLPPSQMAVRA